MSKLAHRKQRQAENLALAAALGMPGVQARGINGLHSYTPDHFWQAVRVFLGWARAQRQPGWSYATWTRHCKHLMKTSEIDAQRRKMRGA